MLLRYFSSYYKTIDYSTRENDYSVACHTFKISLVLPKQDKHNEGIHVFVIHPPYIT